MGQAGRKQRDAAILIIPQRIEQVQELIRPQRRFQLVHVGARALENLVAFHRTVFIQHHPMDLPLIRGPDIQRIANAVRLHQAHLDVT